VCVLNQPPYRCIGYLIIYMYKNVRHIPEFGYVIFRSD
jgi:hypothetical protein